MNPSPFSQANWTNSYSFFSHALELQGVYCDVFDDELWYVVGLSIGPVVENSLDCSPDTKFTSSLFNLSRLKTLAIFDCFTSSHHTTTIPPLMWNKLASSLETLELRSNPGLVGRIPPAIGQLNNLQSLVLVENSLSGQLPEELADLSRLKRLSLEGNEFSGHIPQSLGCNMSHLLILDLSRNNLSGSIPSSIGNLPSLLKLDLSNNNFYGVIPKELGNLKNLTLLDLRSNNLSGGLLAQPLQEMASLQDLLLSDNPNAGGSLAEFKFGSMKNLTSLDLSRMGLDGVIPESIAELRKLRFLALDNNQLCGSVPAKLEALPSLLSLRLNDNDLAGELEFSEEFYRRMGRRFASWSNPRLCYRGGGVYAPHGLNQCRIGKKDHVMRVSNKTEGSSTDSVASVGVSDDSGSGFWGVVLVQELVFVFLLVLFM